MLGYVLGTILCWFRSVNFLKVCIDDSEVPSTSLTVFYVFTSKHDNLQTRTMRPRFLTFATLAPVLSLCNNKESLSFTCTYSMLDNMFIHLSHVCLKFKQLIIGGTWFKVRSV